MVFDWYIWFIIIGTVLFFSRLKAWYRRIVVLYSLPGPKSLPILGNTFLSKSDALEFFRFDAFKTYGSLFRGWLFFLPVIFVLEPKHIQVILGNSKFTDKPFIYSLFTRLFGEGLITSGGYRWKSHRKYIQPYFNINILEQFIPTFVKGTHTMVESLKNLKEVKITTAINELVIEALHESVLGISLEDQDTKECSPFKRGEKLAANRLSKFWMFLNFTYSLSSNSKKDVQQKQTWQEFTKMALERIKTQRVNSNSKKLSFMECLLEISENNEDFTEKDIISECCTFMLAGQDSTSAAMAFTLYFLAKHQDVQDKVVEELNDVFIDSDAINLDTLAKMVYLEQCIKEAMRLWPSVPFFARKLVEDVTLGETIIPAGCTVFFTPVATHRLPHYYPDPETYNPDRFSAENQEGVSPFAYLPFSVGPRNCIGFKLAMFEMKTTIAILLKNYRFDLVAGKEELVTTFRVTIKAKGGIWLKVENPVST